MESMKLNGRQMTICSHLPKLVLSEENDGANKTSINDQTFNLFSTAYGAYFLQWHLRYIAIVLKIESKKITSMGDVSTRVIKNI